MTGLGSIQRGRRSGRGLSPLSVSCSVVGEMLEVEHVLLTPSQGRWAFCSQEQVSSAWLVKGREALLWWCGGRGQADVEGGADVGLPAACLPKGSSAHWHLPGCPANGRPRHQTQEDVCSEPYLVYAFGVFQPRIVHFLHIVGASPAEEGLSSNGGGIAPNLPERPSCGRSVL